MNNTYSMGLTERIEAGQILLPAGRDSLVRVVDRDIFSIDYETLLRIDLDIVSMFQETCDEKKRSLKADDEHTKRDDVTQSRSLVGPQPSEGSTMHHPATPSNTDVAKAVANKSREGKDDRKMTADGSILLPADFQPLPYSVIVGKGKISRNVIGNRRLRVLASNYLTKYDAASDDRDKKSEIVSTILRTIRSACPEGPFIKKGKDGRWYTVNENVAREKVGYTFRDLLGKKYKSSAKAKQAMRRQQKYSFL